MSNPRLLQARPSPDDLPTTPRPAGFHPAVQALFSALLLWSAFPPADWGWLAWVALTPLFLLVRSERSRWSIYTGAWLGGLAFWLLAINWVRHADPGAWLAWIVMALALSFWWPAFVFLARLGVRRLDLPMMIAAPVAWVGLEFVRGYVLTGFPWYYLAHSQYLNLPLIQVADVVGVPGISALIAMANACWADLLTTPLFVATPRGPRVARHQVVRLSAVALGLAITLGYGAYRLATSNFRPGPRLALLQSNIPQSLKRNDPEKTLAAYEVLVARAARDPRGFDLIVWPETSYPFGVVTRDPALNASAFEAQAREVTPDRDGAFWMQKMQDVSAHLHGWVDRLRIPMLIGTITYDFSGRRPSKYNSAVLFEPGKTATQDYYKLHLVPFGEYVPLIESFPWLTALTPYQGDRVPSLTFGARPAWFDLNGFRFATAICFEDSVSRVVRRFFDEMKDGRQPDLLLNLSNDGWFQGSEELDVHLAVSVFRAIENRVPLARAVNTGITALIDGNGRIVDSLKKVTDGVLAATVPLDDRSSLYSRWGDWVGLACLAISIGLVPLALAYSLFRR